MKKFLRRTKLYAIISSCICNESEQPRVLMQISIKIQFPSLLACCNFQFVPESSSICNAIFRRTCHVNAVESNFFRHLPINVLMAY